MEKYNTWQKKLSNQLIISAILSILTFAVWLISVIWH